MLQKLNWKSTRCFPVSLTMALKCLGLLAATMGINVEAFAYEPSDYQKLQQAVQQRDWPTASRLSVVCLKSNDFANDPFAVEYASAWGNVAQTRLDPILIPEMTNAELAWRLLCGGNPSDPRGTIGLLRKLSKEHPTDLRFRHLEYEMRFECLKFLLTDKPRDIERKVFVIGAALDMVGQLEDDMIKSLKADIAMLKVDNRGRFFAEDLFLFSEIAFLRATGPKPLQSPERAMFLAKYFSAIKTHFTLTTLAAAHAANGDYEKALKIQEESNKLSHGQALIQGRTLASLYKARSCFKSNLN